MKLLKLLIFLFFYTSTILSQQQSPNILLIIADDLGVDAIAGFGVDSDLPNTPTLDSFRENGLSFTNYFKVGTCVKNDTP